MVALARGRVVEFITDCKEVAELLINEYPGTIREGQFEVRGDSKTKETTYHFYEMEEIPLRLFIRARHLDEFAELVEVHR
jgi:hypothetical protein